MWLRPHPRPCRAVALLHTSAGCSRSCPCSSEKLFWMRLWFSATSEPSAAKSCWVACTEHKASLLAKVLVAPWPHPPAVHSHLNRPKHLLSLLGESKGTPSSWAFSALARSQHAMADSPERLSASEFLEGITDPAPPTHCTRQLNRQPPRKRHWKARGGGVGSLLP